MNKPIGFIGIDQYGNYYKIDKNPRKELLEKFGVKHAEKMYVDTKDRKIRHCGYIISRHWIEVYIVSVWKEAI
jgi:hypothetical protein